MKSLMAVACLFLAGVNSRAIEPNLSEKNKVNLSERQSTCVAKPLVIFSYDTNSFTNSLGGDSGVDGTGGYTISNGIAQWTPDVSAGAYWFTDLYSESAASGSQCTNFQPMFGTDTTLSVTLGKTTSGSAKVSVGVNVGCGSTNTFVLLGYASLGTGTVTNVFSFKIAPALSSSSDLQKIKAVVLLADTGNVPTGAALTIDNLIIGCESSSVTTTTSSQSSPTNKSTTISTSITTTVFTSTSTTSIASISTSSVTTTDLNTSTTVPSPTVPSTTSSAKTTTTTTKTFPKTTTSVSAIATPPPTVQGASVYNWCGTQKLVALGFDGGTSLENVQLLADLKKYGIKATYFISGPFDQYDCDAIKNIVALGHSIENHSWSHLDSLTLTDAQLKSEITRVQDFITNTCKMNYKFTQFRPPFGSLDFATVKKINQMGYTVASWTYDTNDYESGMTLNKIFNRVVSLQSKLPSNTSTSILHHDDQYKTGVDIGILEKYLDYFKGYKFVTAAECFQACLQEGKCVSPINEWPGVFIDDNYGDPPIHTN